MKKRISIVLSLVLMMSTLLSINAFAKVNLPTISQSKPLITYTYNSSGKVYAYTSSNLKNKTGGYIACATDECKIIGISGNAVKVIYPVSKGTKTAWFSREAFTYRNLASDAADLTFTAKTTVTTYKWKGKSSTFGSVAIGDKCYLLRGNENSDWVQIIYPISGGHKMGWVKGSDYTAMLKGKTTSSNNSSSKNTNTTKKSTTLKSPLKDGLKNTSYSSTTNGIKCDFSASKNTPIYAPADGKVQYIQVYGKVDGKGEYKLISYGNQIKFTSSNGEYNVLMGHLNSFNGVSLKIPSDKTAKVSTSSSSKWYNKGAAQTKVTTTLATKNVSQGDLIGYSGETGNAHGAHLHMEVKDKNGKAVNPISVMETWN